MPGTDDQYTWKILPEKEEKLSKIFEKNLSDHSVSAYKELCDAIGVSFEAVPVTAASDASTLLKIRREPDISFSAKIDALREENGHLAREVAQRTDQANMESNLREHAEQEVHRLRELNQKLHVEVRKSDDTGKFYRSWVLKYSHALNTLSPVLEELKVALPPEDL